MIKSFLKIKEKQNIWWGKFFFLSFEKRQFEHNWNHTEAIKAKEKINVILQ